MSVPFTYLPLSLTLTGHMNNDTIYFNFYSYQVLSTVPGGTSFLIHGLHKSVLYWFVLEDFSILSFCGWLPFKPPYGKKTTLDHLILSTVLLALNFSLFWARLVSDPPGAHSEECALYSVEEGSKGSQLDQRVWWCPSVFSTLPGFQSTPSCNHAGSHPKVQIITIHVLLWVYSYFMCMLAYTW